ncbi:MAG: Na+/H+ antiporter NhaA [bacterium]|nr:Na+/H+ antiporter NhaA [bacterium]
MRTFNHLIKSESASGILLCFTAAIALILANSPFNPAYKQLIETPLSISLGSYNLVKPLVHWVNDSLMSFFFLMIGLEIKREIKRGELNSFSKIMLPAAAAISGMLVPAITYLAFNASDPAAWPGFGIPIATDIAFSLGILSILSTRIPTSLKIFLTALAIFDDIGAILVIAFFYTKHLAATPLLLAVLCVFVLLALNQFKVNKLTPYLFVGAILWFFILKSGIHTTLAGIIVAFTIPATPLADNQFSLAGRLENVLVNWVAFFILPVFAFMNAGVTMLGKNFNELLNPIVLGIACGLFFGKQVGIFLTTFIVVKLKFAPMPRESTWMGIYGVSLLCGIGFTMSLFVGSLAFTDLNSTYTSWVKTGVLLGSFLSGVTGYLVLRFAKVKISDI